MADNSNLIIDAPHDAARARVRAMHIGIELQFVNIDAMFVDGAPHHRRRTTPHQHIGQPQTDATG